MSNQYTADVQDTEPATGPLIEKILPRYDKQEKHRTRITADRQVVWDALHDVRIAELPLTNLLMSLRSGPAAWRKDDDALQLPALTACAPKPLVSLPPVELVLGDIACYTSLRPQRPDVARGDAAAFVRFADPGWTKVAMNFRLVPDWSGTVLTTTTRVHSTDSLSRTAFSFYWWLVRAGSGLIRRDILRAVEKRAMGISRTSHPAAYGASRPRPYRPGPTGEAG